MLATARFCGPVLCLGIGRAAVFAQPAVTKIEEMVCLIHQDEAGTPHTVVGGFLD